MTDDGIRADITLGGEMPGGLTEFWRCPHCTQGMAIGYPGRISEPPSCSTHKAEMEQVTREGFAADWPGETA